MREIEESDVDKSILEGVEEGRFGGGIGGERVVEDRDGGEVGGHSRRGEGLARVQ